MSKSNTVSRAGLCAAIALALAGCGGGGSSAPTVAQPGAPGGSGSSGSGSTPPPSAANAVWLSWVAPQFDEDGAALAGFGGYRIYYGTTPGNYTSTINIENAGLTTYLVEDLTVGETYYFAMTALSSVGVESELSPEVSAAL